MQGRGAVTNPQNRFERLVYEPDPEAEEDETSPQTVFYRDPTRTILAKNDSPDVGFERSINPYRGCEHGCVYCFARPTHEYLGFSAGLDFETRILVKENAPELLREELSSPRWEPQVVAISGVTDPYQPIERGWKNTFRNEKKKSSTASEACATAKCTTRSGASGSAARAPSRNRSARSSRLRSGEPESRDAPQDSRQKRSVELAACSRVSSISEGAITIRITFCAGRAP